MKYQLFFSSLTLILFPAFTLGTALAQPPNLWSQGIGEGNEEHSNASVVDASGNLIFAGEFGGTTDFGNGQVLICEEDSDIFVVKYSPSGTCLWARRFGGADRQWANGIDVDTAGSIYLTGNYRGTLDFGGGPLPFGPEPNSNAYLAKLDSAGVPIWGVGFVCDDLIIVRDLVCDGSNYLHMAGYYKGTVDLGGGALSTSSIDVYLAKFSTVNGAHQWSRTSTGLSIDYGEELALDSSGNVLFAGHFRDTIDFGSGVLTSQGYRDVFLTKFNSAGTNLWSLSFGGPDADEPKDLVVDPADKIVLVGTFQDTVDFGGGPIACDGFRDGFVVQFGSAGNHLWSRSLGGASSDDCVGVGADLGGDITVTGSFTDTLDFGGGPHVAPAAGRGIYVAKLDRNGVYKWSYAYGDTSSNSPYLLDVTPGGEAYSVGFFGYFMSLGGPTLEALGAFDMFVAKHDDAGNHLWSHGVESLAYDMGLRVATPLAGGIVYAGFFSGFLEFGPHQSAGYEDIFLAKCDDDGIPIWSQSFGNTGSETLGSMSDDGTGRILMTGGFEHSIDFGGGTLTAPATEDGFVAKFTGGGAHMWSHSFGATQAGFGADVVGDGSGNVYLAGDFAGSMNLGGGVLTSTDGWDIFLAKFDAAGNHLWSQKFGISGEDHVKRLCFTPAGGVVLTGTFTGSVDFGLGALASAGLEDVFVARFSAAGRPLWSQAFGDAQEDDVEGLTADPTGAIVLTGRFNNTIDFGGGALVSSGGSDIFLAQLSDAGIHTWSASYGGIDDDGGISVSVNADGTLLWTGCAVSDIDLGGGTLPGEGLSDVLLARFSNGGVHLWSTRFGWYWKDCPGQAVEDPAGNVVITGYFTGGTYIGDTWIGTTGGDRDGFLARFGWEATGVGEDGPVLGGFLHPARPNPFRSSVGVLLEVASPTVIRASVYDIRGRRIRVLLDQALPQGVHTVQWDARDSRGVRMPAGVYFLRAKWAGGVSSQRVVLIN